MTEAEVTKEIRKLLNLLGIWHWKQWQGPMSQPKGVSDILGIYQDTVSRTCPHCKMPYLDMEVKPLAIEVKAPKGKLTRDQKFFSECWKLEKGIFILARSAWDVVVALGLEHKFK